MAIETREPLGLFPCGFSAVELWRRLNQPFLSTFSVEVDCADSVCE
jgi:hypothetical protein